MTEMITFENVCKSFGKTVILNDFNFRVMRGEKVAIIGPSGSGKSTLLRIIMALQDIDHGKVSIDGKPLWEVNHGRHLVKPTRRHLRDMRSLVGMVFQNFNLFPNLTALGNVAAAPRHVLGLSKKESEARAAALLAQVGLSEKLSNYPSTLSGGQQQRVAIARAMALEPKVMLFDEATSALDPELVGEVLGVMRDLASARDLTVLVVTHQMGVARAIADRVCFMEGGCVVEEGGPEALLSQPKNERTRAFLRAVHLA
ncbi:polar amino acid transport system ATP-binding protein [Neorhizobium galegae]|uniref:amino acid ABC transporter ATP-binding protein n=1 Tax=Neorhizobium galegae TaxID=399 RepID=UPI001AEA0209|nr:amino acid ABC transporter ATP-binding protein [Neorhizobium galegae]MBP2562493.1 polar amino acid transport system ATP-binding protein [Neorhizobium galegae]